MTLRARLAAAWIALRRPAASPPVAASVDASTRRARYRRAVAQALARARTEREAKAPRFELKRYEPARGVLPDTHASAILARDRTPYDTFTSLSSLGVYGAASVTGFMGYPYLAVLSQVPEYRKMATTLADEMTRAGIRFTTTGAQDEEGDELAETRAERMVKLADAMIRFNVIPLLRRAIELEAYFGRVQLYVNVAKRSGALASDDPLELKTPLFLDSKKIGKGSLKNFRIIEACWSYPNLYNSTNPLKDDYYAPDIWYVQNQQVHASRLLMIISNPVPDMLKAAYAFGGVPLIQLAEPYVNNWLRTRDSVGDIVHAFSTSGILTDLSSFLALPMGEDGPTADTDPMMRAELFTTMKDNKGLMLLDKETEEFFQVNTPLAGLDKLQAQAQEQLSAVSSIPLVKLLGITPSGLNASTDGEVRVFYDHVMSQCEKVLRAPLTTILQILQLNEFGFIDPGITFVFEPLHQLSDAEKATTEKTRADTDTAYLNSGVVSPEEVRAALAADDESRYHGIDVSDVPEPEVPDETDPLSETDEDDDS